MLNIAKTFKDNTWSVNANIGASINDQREEQVMAVIWKASTTSLPYTISIRPPNTEESSPDISSSRKVYSSMRRWATKVCCI